MDERERTEILNAALTMDGYQKRIYYEQKKKNAALMMILSLIIPGLGQMIMGDLVKGLIILLLSWLFIPWLYGIYNAYKSAERYNAELYYLLFPANDPRYNYPNQAQ